MLVIVFLLYIYLFCTIFCLFDAHILFLRFLTAPDPISPSLQVSTFNEIVDPTGQSDEDSYKALTALGILSAIQSLVKATFNETDVCVCVCVCVCVLFVCGGRGR